MTFHVMYFYKNPSHLNNILMNAYGISGMAAELGQYETPFADSPIVREQRDDESNATNGFYSNYMQETESPFARTYEVDAVANILTPAGEEFINFLGELNDKEFTESLYEIADEVENTWRSKVSNELLMGENYLPFVRQQANDYFAPLEKETVTMIDRVSQHFSGNNLADHTEMEIDAFFETYEFNHRSFTPAQEQFFGKVFNKVKSVVKKGVELAKKGISVVGKFLPHNIILNKIKGLIRPLLDKVLKFAIGKLPRNLQPHAQTLAKKFLKLETVDEATADGAQSENEIESIQTEFDSYIAQLVFSPEETSADQLVTDYEISFETVDRINSYESGSIQTRSLDAVRQQFINELKDLQPGESAAPAIERFLPVAIVALQPVIKMAIKLIGRQKIINFLAGLLAKLVSKYVPANVAQPLAANIIDIGMSAIGFEVHETGKSDLAYEAIANTIEETVQNMNKLDEAAINDSETLTMHLLEAFEKAAVNNFPPQYIKEELRPTKQKATWVAMPRNLPVKLYKKFTHVYDITIDPQTASTVSVFRGLPLANFLKDKYGLDVSKAVKAKVHLYETKLAGRLSLISKFEKLPGLNSNQPKAWVQLLPLTTQAASLILKEPALGKDVDPKGLATRFQSQPGQRFYFLEIEGAKLRIPQVNRSRHKHSDAGKPVSGTESRSADIHGVINFVKSELTLNYYFSEEDAREVVEKLNKGDFLGAAMSIRQSIKNVLNNILVKNIASKVKIVHESLPELYLENIRDNEEQFAPLDAIGKLAGKELISKLIEKLIGKISTVAYDSIVNFFKARATEFKEAQAQPQDGVTIRLSWKNVGGMSALRTVINAIRGNSSFGNLKDLSLPAFQPPEISVLADKKFE